MKATVEKYSKASELYNEMTPDQISNGIFFIKGSMTQNAQFCDCLHITSEEHILSSNKILRITISQRDEFLMANVRQRIYKSLYGRDE